MNVLFVLGNGNLSSQMAQLALFLKLQEKDINIQMIGELTQEVINYTKEQNPTAKFQNIYPTQKFDKNYQKTFLELVIANKIDIVHFVSGQACRNGMVALKKQPQVKTAVYFGSSSLYWYDPFSYFTYLHPRLNAIIGNSNYVYNHVKKQLFGKHKEKAVRIFKGYSTTWFKDVKPFDYTQLGIPKNSIIACSISQHRKVKGTKYFLESSNFLDSKKDIHYVLIGHKTDNDDLVAIKNKSKIADKIHILGKRNDVPALLAGADMYLQTSLNEGFGRAISEAMCIAKPIIMTNAGGCTELIDKNSGIVVPLKDSKAIGKAVSKLADDNTLRIKMGKNAKQRIENVYSVENTVEDTLSLYKKLLNY